MISLWRLKQTNFFPVNLLAEQFEEARVSAVATKTQPSPTSKRSLTPAPSSHSSSQGPCWYHKKHGNKAQHCQKPCWESEN